MRANRYVSYLAAEIEPSALSTINKFERATESAFAKIEKLSSRGLGNSGLAGFDAGTARNAGSVANAMARARSEINRTDSSVVRLTRDTSAMATTFTRASQALNVVQGPLGPLAGRLSALGAAFRDLSGLSLAGVLAGGGAFAIGNIATQYQAVTDKLRPFAEGQSDLNRQMTQVIGIARDTRQALEPVSSLYIKIGQASKEAGIEQERAVRLTETVAKAAKLSGGDAQTQANGLTQFAQGFGSGTLSGEELKSIKENTFRLAKALAEGLDVPIAKLKELGAQGLLTPELITQALERSAAQIDLEFSKIPKRVGTSLTEAGNNLSIFIGRIDEATGATTGLAEAISFLGSNIPAVTTAAIGLAAAFNARYIVDGFRAGTQAVNTYATGVTNAVRYQQFLNQQQVEGNALYASASQRAVLRAQTQAAAAREEIGAIKSTIEARKADQVQLQKQIVLIEQQRQQQIRSRNAANTLAAAGTSGTSSAVVDANRAVAQSLAARIRTEQILRATNVQLLASENGLIAATRTLAVAQEQENLAMLAAGPAVARLSVAQTALTAVKTRLLAAGSSLVGFLGGPWGVAFTVAAVAATYLASNVSAAETAINSFEGGQVELQRVLGITTGKLQEQSAAARQLALDLATAGVAKARQSALDTQSELGSTLGIATSGGSTFGRNRSAFPGTAQGYKDRQALAELARKAREGKFDFESDYPTLAGIRTRNPNAFKGNFIDSILGRNPEDALQKIEGVVASTLTLKKAEEELARVREDLNKPRTAAPAIPQARSKSQLISAGLAAAAKTDLAKARAELSRIKAEGRQEGETEDAFIDRIATAKKNVDALAASNRGGSKASSAAAKAAREHAAALKAQDVAAERARDKADKLASIMSRFTDDPPLIRQAEAAKRALADLFTENKGGKLIRDDASIAKYGAQIDAFLRKPLEDATLESERQYQILQKILAGRADEADVLREAYTLLERTGSLTDKDLEQIRERQKRERDINMEIEKRGQLIDLYARAAGDFQDNIQATIREAFDNPFAAGGNFFKRVISSYKDQLAEELTIKLFGGNAETRARDAMTRGLNGSADRLTTSADLLQRAGSELSAAAEAIASAATATPATAPGGVPLVPGRGLIGSFVELGAAAAVPGAVTAAVNAVIGPFGVEKTSSDDLRTGAVNQAQDGADLVVTARRSNVPTSLEDAWNKAGAQIGKAVFGQNSPVSKVLAKVGTALEGAAIGGAVNSTINPLAKALGVKTSQTGAQIGGAVGTFLPIPGGQIIGSIVGSVVGGLFKKTKTGSASITSIDGAASLSGNSGSYKKEAGGLASNVQGGLARIAEALGGETGDFAVSIGKRKKSYVVDPTGQGRTKGSGVLKFEDANEAAQAAILNALEDGAITGIREGSKRLLKAGQDLDTALSKALKFENVFRRLKAREDPIGAAVEDVNREFKDLINVFNQAGASAEEFAQLEKLYGLERADAIEAATRGSVERLQQFIDQALGGSDSPLDRSTVYANARGALSTFEADIKAGKLVDQDKFLEAVDNFDSASRELNGSRQSYFADFDYLLALVGQAKNNVNGASTSTGLPASPFDDTLNKTLTANTGELVTQTEILRNIQSLLASGGLTGYAALDGKISSMGLLPAYQN